MHFHTQDHIYLAQFCDCIILLDTKRDTYTICSEDASKLLIELLEPKSKLWFSKPPYTTNSSASFNHQSHLKRNTIIQKLINDNIITRKDLPHPFYIDRKHSSNGVSNVEWLLPLDNQEILINFKILEAFIVLMRVNFHIKYKGFYSMIQLLKKVRGSSSNYITPHDRDLEVLANIVNKACLIYPTRIKCLEWSITFVLLALKRKWICNIEIGVQTYPFFAHAWVECNERVVMDDQHLRESLSIILHEPFRKLRT